MNRFSKGVFLLVFFITMALYIRISLLGITNAYYDQSIDTDSIKYYLLLMAMLCGGFVLVNPKPNHQVVNSFIVFMVYSWVIAMINHNTSSNIKDLIVLSFSILLPMLVLWMFYHVPKIYTQWFTLFVVFLAYIIFLNTFIETYQITLLLTRKDVAINSSSYIMLFFLPFFLLSEKKWIRIISYLFVASVMVISMKRGGFIALVLASVAYYLVDVIVSKKSVRFQTLFGFLIVFMLIYFGTTLFFESYIDDMFGRLNDIDSDRGSDRLDIYETTWKMIAGSDPVSLIFGHGWDVVKRDSPMGYSAHNDFLEVLYDFGIIGFMLYIMFLKNLFKLLFTLIKFKSEIAPAFAFSLGVFVVNSIVAHVIIYPFYLISCAAVWGYMLGKEKVRQLSIIRNQF